MISNKVLLNALLQIIFPSLFQVSESIDYEVKHSYKFHVIAEDNGTPRISTHVDVVINITDLNDNPPLINRNHSNVIVQEGTQPGSNLLELFITDLDSPANAAPFFCSLLNGDVRRFAVVTGKRNNCVIQSKTYMDLRERDTYDLVVRVTDSGKHVSLLTCIFLWAYCFFGCRSPVFPIIMHKNDLRKTCNNALQL